MHPETYVVEPENFPGDAPAKLLELVGSQYPEINNLIVEVLEDYSYSNPVFADELREFRETGKSNGRSMKWHLMKIEPNTSFKLHAHPNIELIYVIRGTMNEIRLSNPAPKREFSPEESFGPPLSDPAMKLAFIHRSTGGDSEPSDRFLVNEKGSIHLTYTTDDGAELLVLWSGGHANIPLDQYPPNASEALQLAESVEQYKP